MVTAPHLVVDSLPQLYRAMSDELTAYLHDHFRVTVSTEELSDLLGYLVTARRPSAAKSLVVAEDATDAEKVYLFVHTAAHILLGHADRPFGTILEPRRTRRGNGQPAFQLDARQVQRDRQADALARAIIWGREKEAANLIRRYAGRRDAIYLHAALEAGRTMSGLLLGHKYPRLQRALVSRVTRKAVLKGLRIARAAYHGLAGIREALSHGNVVRDLREVYYLTELATLVPELVLVGQRATSASDVRAAPPGGAYAPPLWLDVTQLQLADEPGVHDAARLN
ncbi:MAG: hypothetical protein IT307_04155 [Chloroflexi bacterium]|nr:hypothetical protein [Chloroflexota bacterium]